MSEAKKSFAEKAKSLKKTETLTRSTEKKEEIQKGRGRPKSTKEEKQTKSMTIYLNNAQIAIIEQKAVKEGYSPKDKAKWLKELALSEEEELNTKSEKELLKAKATVVNLKMQLKAKDELIEVYKSMNKVSTPD